MSVRDQDAIQTTKAQTGAQDLALGSLAAVNQEALVSEAKHLRGEAAVDGRSGCGCAKEGEFEQRNPR